VQQKEAKKTNFCVTLFRLQKMKNSKKKFEKMKISIRMKTENGLITLSGSAKNGGGETPLIFNKKNYTHLPHYTHGSVRAT
tara:strand:- start:877 stop:1119 length:243 start_codon:yes stop_codon:yes gene_type:complete